MSAEPPPEFLVTLRSEAETAEFGAWLGAHLGPGDAVLLSGPIGAGKTHLVRALIQSRLGQPDAEVPSPTFTLVQTYEAPGITLWHADLYRIGHPDEVVELGLDAAFEDAIVLVEWPERLGRWRPANPIAIDLLPQSDARIARISPGKRPALAAALGADWNACDA
jgi:tRNA threonylcarbamoyladenosine biosynthesis protein TsaE